ncbi:MAG: hypothetical protein R3F34_19540 [Planctomycetota bacterium]
MASRLESDRGPAAPPTSEFEREFRRTVQGLRGALTELLEAVHADYERPQNMARNLGLDKSLAWRASRIVRESEATEILRHLPGAAGWNILLDKLGKEGAEEESVARLGDAIEQFNEMTRTFAGDRRTLELFVRGLSDRGPSSTELERPRKLAFEGNVGIWGVRAKTHASVAIAFPNRDDASQVDLIRIIGLSGFQRLHSEIPWLLFRREVIEEGRDAEGKPPRIRRPLDSTVDPQGIPLIPAFCTQPLPEISRMRVGSRMHFVLEPERVVRTAPLDCFHGDYSTAIGPAYRTEKESIASLGTNIETPVARLVVDVLVHDDLEWQEPVLKVRGPLAGSMELPVVEEIVTIGRGLRSIAAPRLPRYPEMLAWTFERAGLDPSDFVHRRFVMTYPPLHSLVMVDFALPTP